MSDETEKTETAAAAPTAKLEWPVFRDPFDDPSFCEKTWAVVRTGGLTLMGWFASNAEGACDGRYLRDAIQIDSHTIPVQTPRGIAMQRTTLGSPIANAMGPMPVRILTDVHFSARLDQMSAEDARAHRELYDETLAGLREARLARSGITAPPNGSHLRRV